MNWPQSVGAMLASLAVFAVSFGLIRLKKQKRDKRNERPPQEEKILRPAGHYAMCRLDDFSEQLMWVVFASVGAGIIFGATLGGFWPLLTNIALGRSTLARMRADPNFWFLLGPAVLALVALLVAIREFQVLWRLLDEVRNWRFGLRGEQAVAEKLMDGRLAAAGYVVFNDLPAEKGGRKWNVDHLVVGPAGVFVLETKAKPKRTPKWDQKPDEVFFNGKMLTFPWCYDDWPAKQVQNNVGWVREYLGVYAPEGLSIQPVVVVPGWTVRPLGNYEVKVMNAEYLVQKYLTTLKPIYSPQQLATVIKRIDDGCRSLEF